MKVLVTQSCPPLCNPMDCSPPGSLSMGFSRKNTGVGCHFLSPGIFPTQGWNPGLLHRRRVLYHPSHQGSPLSLQGPHHWLPFTTLVSLPLLTLSGHTPAFGPLPLFTSAWNVLLDIHAQALIHPLTFSSSTVTSPERLFSTAFPKVASHPTLQCLYSYPAGLPL